ncbi:hypothetical protein J2W48_003763 [Flavobacterium piscis]|uniref:Uncharacterized protein n=1 Tax=Flavobacterium piscis TaxID=1114874 RepID=A0ABU1YC25_9FLAO|nr:hypothetical protein [Flavobacterium piscis]
MGVVSCKNNRNFEYIDIVRLWNLNMIIESILKYLKIKKDQKTKC